VRNDYSEEFGRPTKIKTTFEELNQSRIIAEVCFFISLTNPDYVSIDGIHPMWADEYDDSMEIADLYWMDEYENVILWSNEGKDTFFIPCGEDPFSRRELLGSKRYVFLYGIEYPKIIGKLMARNDWDDIEAIIMNDPSWVVIRTPSAVTYKYCSDGHPIELWLERLVNIESK